MRDNIFTIAYAGALLMFSCSFHANAQTVSSPVSASTEPNRGRGAIAIRQGVQHDLPAIATALADRLRRLPASGFEGEFRLRQLVAMLNQSGIPTLVDRRGLRDEGLSLDDVIEISSAGVPMDDRLSHALHAIACGWTVTPKGTAILISSKGWIEESLMVVTYDLSQLTSSRESRSIKNAITSTISPEYWEDVGGSSSIQAVNVRGRDLLVVSTTYHVHLRVAKLLNSLHRMGGDSLVRSDRAYTRSSTLPMSQPIEVPTRASKRGINLPGANSHGNMGGFGGMMGMGGMF